MAMVISIPDEAAQRLRAAASARGLTAEELAVDLVVEHLAELEAPATRRRLALSGIGASGSGLSHRIDEILDEGFGRD